MRRSGDAIPGVANTNITRLDERASFMSLVTKQRVIAYIDGFNLYHGMMEAGLENCRWLDVKRLTENLLSPREIIVGVKYFTSRTSGDPQKQKKQSTYIEALETLGVEIIYGHYQNSFLNCTQCGNTWAIWKEKMTDVNIATHMVVDAYQDKYDLAVLISGDSDLVPPIRAVHSNFKNKSVFVAFPPCRQNVMVRNSAKGSMPIGRKKLVDSQLPPIVTKRDGFNLGKPTEWN